MADRNDAGRAPATGGGCAHRVTRSGRDWLDPRYQTPWQRERAEPPFEGASEADSALTWAISLLVCTIFWTAVFAWFLS